MFGKVTVIGPGLLGGSLCLALSENKMSDRIVLWARTKESCQNAQKTFPFAEVEENLAESVTGSELVVICTPVETITDIIREIIPHLSKKALVTDVGSVKKNICQAAEDLFKNETASFIGSHPMAGSEKSGMKYANANLFNSRPCIITPSSMKDGRIVDVIIKFWERLGMVVYQKDSMEHDYLMAELSHLPHLVASVLSHALQDKTKNARQLAGQGLRDTTRVSAGNSNLWSFILSENKPNLIKAINQFKSSLKEAEKILSGENIEELKKYLEKGSLFRKSIE